MVRQHCLGNSSTLLGIIIVDADHTIQDECLKYLIQTHWLLMLRKVRDVKGGTYRV